MAKLNTEYCVEIRAPLKTTGSNFGSGYSLGLHWVITARHVLFDKTVDETKPIEIRWWNETETDWKGEPLPVDRDQIVWQNMAHDIALIRCEIPYKNVPAAWGLILQHRPDGNSTCDCAGYLSHLKNGNNGQRRKTPVGTLGKSNSAATSAHINGLNVILEEGELWEGFSGSPVFSMSTGQFFGIVTDFNTGEKGSLVVSFLDSALDAQCDKSQTLLKDVPKFWLPPTVETLRSWFKPLFLGRLEKSEILTKQAIASFNPQNKNTPVTNADELAEALLESPPAQCVAMIETLHEKQKQIHDSVDTPILHDLAILMMSLVFPDQEAVKIIQSSRMSGEPIIKSITADRIDTEAAMATADHDISAIKYHKGDALFPYNVTPNEKRCGLDDGHQQAAKDIAQRLTTKLLPGECGGAIENLWLESFNRGAAGAAIAKLEKDDDVLKQLAKRMGKKSRRFYALLAANTQGDQEKSWSSLKERLPELDLIQLNEFSNTEIVDLIADLEEIILATHGDIANDKND
ncbi:MAG TPA: serine protease [Gammaproteobacteria bacterium]|nr:serine protease [Gammaproteobacteria bacterium]